MVNKAAHSRSCRGRRTASRVEEVVEGLVPDWIALGTRMGLQRTVLKICVFQTNPSELSGGEGRIARGWEWMKAEDEGIRQMRVCMPNAR